MPSLWKKQKGNKRISRVVADLQTPPKRGGSLVVETGFPTSIVDLFVKNRDKFKKQKTKKHKSKKSTTISDDGDGDYQPSSLLNHPPGASLFESDVPRCSIVKNCEEKVDNFEENVVNNDLSFKKHVAHETPLVDSDHDCGKIVEASDSKTKLLLLAILMGTLFFVMVLHYEIWVPALITLGILLWLLSVYLGNIDVEFFRPCKNGVSNWGLKIGLIVITALYTGWFVVGITIGACLLILLQYTKNSIFEFFKPYQDTIGKLQGIMPNWGVSNEQRRKEVRGVLTRAMLIGSKGEVLNNEEIDLVSKKDLDKDQDQDYSLIEEEKQVKPSYELSSLESDNIQEEKGANGRSKAKKNKKFWKKLVSKKKISKKRKHPEHADEICVAHSDSIYIQDTVTDKDEEDEEEEEEINEEKLSKSISISRSKSKSSLNMEDEVGIEKFEAGNFGSNMKYFVAIVIPITGLVGGRIIAIAVTVVCCLVLKMV